MKKQHFVLAIAVVMMMCSYSLTVFADEFKPITIDEIYAWTQKVMKAPAELEQPEIILIDRKGLQEAFKKNNQKSFQRWTEEYGSDKAQKIIDNYLEELLGLFDPKTNSIYVGSFMDECKRNAVIAHEMVHYIQEYMNLPNSTVYMSPDNVHLFREFQAYKYEDKFKKEFCIKS